MRRVFAAADIGSNTAHLLVAASDGELVTRIDNVSEWVGLGETVARLGHIPQEKVDQLVRAISAFKTVATSKRAEALYVFATEAMRAASNHEEVLKTIRRETGVTIDLVSPRREAELSWLGVRLDCSGYAFPNLIAEVGGGSAQVGLIHDGELGEEISLPLGTGRLLASLGLKNPCSPDVLQEARGFIEAEMIKIPFDPVGATEMVASGGVVRGLWRALHPDGEKELSLYELDYLVQSTSKLTLDRVIARFNVKPKRAGTLLVGALVYSALLRRFDAETLQVSEFGVREGAMIDIVAGKVQACLL